MWQLVRIPAYGREGRFARTCWRRSGVADVPIVRSGPTVTTGQGPCPQRQSNSLTGLLCDTLAAAPLGQSLRIVWVLPSEATVPTRKAVTIATATARLSNILTGNNVTRLPLPNFGACRRWSPRDLRAGKANPKDDTRSCLPARRRRCVYSTGHRLNATAEDVPTVTHGTAGQAKQPQRGPERWALPGKQPFWSGF